MSLMGGILNTHVTMDQKSHGRLEIEPGIKPFLHFRTDCNSIPVTVWSKIFSGLKFLTTYLQTNLHQRWPLDATTESQTVLRIIRSVMIATLWSITTKSITTTTGTRGTSGAKTVWSWIHSLYLSQLEKDEANNKLVIWYIGHTS